MGIPGFSSYVQSNSDSLLVNHELRNCQCIIDGNNFLHQILHWEDSINAAFGGDYDGYDSVSRSIFKHFKFCQVTPIVIFDGSFEERKLETILKRNEERIRSSVRAHPAHRTAPRFAPPLAKLTFIQVMEELGVAFAQSELEADDEISALARFLGCPILSNDSDFFLADVSVVPLWSLDVRSCLNPGSNPTISCKIYHLESLLSCNRRLDKSVIPLLSVILGNDYISSDVFGRFYSNVLSASELSTTHGRIRGLIRWLCGRSCTSALREVLRHTPEHHKNLVNSAVTDSICSFTRKNSPLTAILHLGDTDCNYASVSGMPQWFITDFLLHKLPSELLDIIRHRKAILKCQVESMEFCSAHTPIFSLLKCICALLLPSGDNVTVSCYTRKSQQMVKKLIEVEFKMDCCHLENLRSISQEERMEIFLQSLDLRKDDWLIIQEFPEQIHLFMCAVVYFGRHADPPITRTYISALLLCLISLSIVDQTVGRHPLQKRAGKSACRTSEKLVLNSCEEHCHKAAQNFIPFHRIQSIMHSSHSPFDSRIVHQFSQFQACYLQTYHLSALLGSIVAISKPAGFFSGTFLYNVGCTLQNSQNEKQYIESLLVEKSSCLNSLFQKMSKRLRKLLPNIAECLPRKRAVEKSKATLSAATKKKTGNCSNKFVALSMDED